MTVNVQDNQKVPRKDKKAVTKGGPGLISKAILMPRNVRLMAPRAINRVWTSWAAARTRVIEGTMGKPRCRLRSGKPHVSHLKRREGHANIRSKNTTTSRNPNSSDRETRGGQFIPPKTAQKNKKAPTSEGQGPGHKMPRRLGS